MEGKHGPCVLIDGEYAAPAKEYPGYYLTTTGKVYRAKTVGGQLTYRPCKVNEKKKSFGYYDPMTQLGRPIYLSVLYGDAYFPEIEGFFPRSIGDGVDIESFALVNGSKRLLYPDFQIDREHLKRTNIGDAISAIEKMKNSTQWRVCDPPYTDYVIGDKGEVRRIMTRKLYTPRADRLTGDIVVTLQRSIGEMRVMRVRKLLCAFMEGATETECKTLSSLATLESLRFFNVSGKETETLRTWGRIPVDTRYSIDFDTGFVTAVDDVPEPIVDGDTIDLAGHKYNVESLIANATVFKEIEELS